MSGRPAQLLFGSAALVAALLLVLPTPDGIEPRTMRAAAAVVLVIGFWSTAVVPPFLGSLVFLFAAMVLAVAPAAVVFSGFHAGAMWLVFGGLVIGHGVQRSGLDVRLVRQLLDRFPRRYTALLYGIYVAGLLLAFIIPSASGRVALLVPIMLALADRLGFAPESRGRAGLVLAATMGTMVPAFAILPANVPNMGLYGAGESIYGYTPAYADYFVLNFPVGSLFSLLVYPALIALLFRDVPVRPAPGDAGGPWRGDERRLLAIVLAALALWVTDTLHGVSPAWVALGAALVCVAPRVGVLPPKALSRDIDYGPLLFLAGIIGLGAVATDSGLGALVADRLLAQAGLARGADASNFAVIIGTGVGVGIFTTLPAQPSILAPLAQGIADATGWSVESVLLATVASWSVFPFPYQAPPLVIAIGLAHLRLLSVFRLLIAYFVLAAALMLPLHFLWGRWLGYFTATG